MQKKFNTMGQVISLKKGKYVLKELFRVACIAILSLSFTQAIASTTVAKEITGTVSNDSEPLIGATVLEKGTSNGVATDVNGNYKITVAGDDAVLIFSYTGHTSQEITVGGQSTIDVTLQEGTALDEVVVVGYTTRKKGELTGSVSSVGGESLEQTSNKDLVKSLSGRVTGLIVSDRGGYPGSTGDVSILIRGKSTLNNNAPLILVDGIPSESFSHLAPQDIESISVLKDGAAAIYGARAANGVILVTTRRGKAGKPKINFTSMYTASTFSALPKLMTSEQFAIYRNEAAERYNLPTRFTQEQIDNYAAGADPILYPSTDWAEATFADFSPEWRSSLSVSGGTDKAKYFVSGDYLDLTGMYASKDLTFNQYQLRSNVDIKLHEYLTVGVDVFGRFGDRNEPGVDDGFIYKHIYTNEPTEVVTYPNGLTAWGGENGANPTIMSSSESGFVNRKDNNLRSKLSVNLDLGWLVDGLSAQGYAGIRNWTTDTKSWYTPWTVYTYQQGTDEYVPQAGFSQQGAERTLTERFWKYNELMLNGTLRYNKTFDKHSVGVLAGYEQFTSESRTFEAQRRGFPSDNHPELFAGSDEGQISTGSSQEFGRVNYFGSISYDYGKKYFVDLTLRHDGSSNFGPGNRFGTFPGVALAWSIGEESFMDAAPDWIDAVKLRASWALMGNDRVGAYQFLTRYNYGSDLRTNAPSYYTFGTPGVRDIGYRPANVPNPDITWETADMRNIGLNFALFDYKLTADINYFYQKRTGILIRRNASIPVLTGLTLPSENLGEVDNFGMEVELGWKDKIGDITYNIGANLTQARNQVVYLDEAADVPDYQKREGFPMDSYMVYPTDGIFQDQAQVDATIVKKDGTTEGEFIYTDTNGDGVIDALDRVRIYSSNVPEIQYGITGGLSYKGFDFNFLLQGQARAQMLVFFDQSGSLPEYVFTERWTPDNRNSRYPRAFDQGDIYSGNQNNSDNFQGADMWLHDASFLRLKEVEIGYRLTKEQIKFGNLRVFARGFNVLTMFSEVAKLGLDPEAAAYNNFRASTYPSLKSYSFGFNLTF